MKKILVTGGAGFIGSHITEELVKQGHKVIVLDNFSTGSKKNLAKVINGVEIIEGDIRNLELLKQKFTGVDAILHQAALRSVPASLKDPQAYTDVNITGIYNVLEAARVSGVNRVVFASSSSVYGDSTDLPQKEEKTGTRLSPYAISKFTGEDYCKFFHRTYGLETVALRYFNVFGPRQDPKSQYAAVIPLFITALLRNEQPTIFGDGKQTRDFTYVSNVVQANICAITANAAGQSINIANGEGTSVNELFEKIKRFLNKDSQPHYAPERTGDVKHTKADTTKMKQLLAFEPIKFDEGLKTTVEWYCENYR